jgi:hypothetical protein
MGSVWFRRRESLVRRHFHSLHRDLTKEQENLSKMIRAELQI